YNVVNSYKVYKEKLSSGSSSDGVLGTAPCEGLNYKHVNQAKVKFPQLCSTAIQFLNHLKENSHNYRDDGCKYLYYSLYVDVLKREKSTEKTLILYKELNQIFNEVYDGMNELDSYINKMDEYTSDILVKLIDIYDKFDEFENEFKLTGKINKCPDECVELFKGYLDACRNRYDYDFCYELNNFREKYNLIIEQVTNCKGEKYILPPVEIFETGGIIFIPFAIIVVATFIFPILYKFTAFGPWIRRSLGIKKNMCQNINEETNHSLHISEMGKKSLKKRNYNIAYNSS
ncbi:PIR Superfamily Protein, partial [Plasmodium ovale curtisi]